MGSVRKMRQGVDVGALEGNSDAGEKLRALDVDK